MTLGGFAPLPIRLGGDGTTGWTAAQHARAAADLQAVALASDFAVLTFVKAGATITIESYLGQNGVGLAAAPTAVSGGTGITVLTWPNVHEDDYGRVRPVHLTDADATALGSSNICASCTTVVNAVGVYTFTADTGAAVDARVSLAVGPGLLTDARIGHYDGATDKIDSATEGDVPYAWTWYQEYEAMLGSAFSKERSGFVHAKKLALARQHASIDRLGEKFRANAKPGTADELQAAWVELLNVKLRGTETKQEIRQRCAARLIASRGPTWTRVDEACAALLGDSFVRTWRRYGVSPSTPPTQTFWPGVNPGPSSHSLGGGAWLSERAHLVVETTRAAGLSEGDYLHLVNVELFRMLDEMLPAWATFDFAEDITDGFLLDISQLDYGGLTD